MMHDVGLFAPPTWYVPILLPLKFKEIKMIAETETLLRNGDIATYIVITTLKDKLVTSKETPY